MRVVFHGLRIQTQRYKPYKGTRENSLLLGLWQGIAMAAAGLAVAFWLTMLLLAIGKLDGISAQQEKTSSI